MVGRRAEGYPTELSALVAGTSKYLSAAVSPSTSSQYHRAWQSFISFCASYRLESLPAVPSTVALFITFLADASPPSSPATIASVLSAIGYMHKLSSFLDPTQHFVVRKILKGVSNRYGASDLRVPISPAILSDLIAAASRVSASAYEGKLLSAMFSLMFHAFLRLGEVTSSLHNLLYQNIVFSDASCDITFSSYKHSSGRPVTVVVHRSRTPSCPVALLDDFVRSRGAEPGPLFCYPGALPMSAGRFRTLLGLALLCCGKKDLKITPHSFRIGAATYAAAKGYSDVVIQSMGRWKSAAYRRYVRLPAL